MDGICCPSEHINSNGICSPLDTSNDNYIKYRTLLEALNYI